MNCELLKRHNKKKPNELKKNPEQQTSRRWDERRYNNNTNKKKSATFYFSNDESRKRMKRTPATRCFWSKKKTTYKLFFISKMKKSNARHQRITIEKEREKNTGKIGSFIRNGFFFFFSLSPYCRNKQNNSADEIHGISFLVQCNSFYCLTKKKVQKERDIFLYFSLMFVFFFCLCARWTIQKLFFHSAFNI